MQGQYGFLQQDPRFLQQQQAASQRQPGPLQSQQTGYVQPQQTGYVQPQQIGYMQPQQTGFVQTQQTGVGFLQQQPLQQAGHIQPQRTGFVQPQMTGFSSGGMMRPQQTGFGFGASTAGGAAPPVPSLPSAFHGHPQPNLAPGGPSASGYMTGTHHSSAMAAQPTGYGMGFRGQMPALGASSQPFLNTFLPASGAPQSMTMGNSNFQPSQMQFAQQASQLNGMSLQQTFQQQNQQQMGQAVVRVPWKLSSEEKKSYDQIFRAWDQAGTGFMEGRASTEVFAQSSLPREDLMQIWALADVDNRGKLNLAEFHVAMGLIYRRLNGNPIPASLPPEMVPPSARDLDNSVDFLKDLLKKDNARSTGESYGQRSLGPVRSLHGARSSPNLHTDATMYKHDEAESFKTYKSSSRHIDRRAVRHPGEDRTSARVDDVKRVLDRTDGLIESSRRRDDDDDVLEQELEDVHYGIRRIEDDLEHITRSGRRSEARDNERRQLERDLIRLRHEDLPQIEAKLEDRQRERRREADKYSRQRDLKNNSSRFDQRGAHGDPDNTSRHRDSQPDRGYLRDTYDRDLPSRASDRDRRDLPSRSSYRESPLRDEKSDRYDNSRRDSQSTRASALSPSTGVTKSPPPLPTTPAAGVPSKAMTAEEKKAFIQAEAQRRIQERLRSLGIGATSSTPSLDAAVESRLEQEKKEAALQASKADKEAEEREVQRQIRLEEERLSRIQAEEEINAKVNNVGREVKSEVQALPITTQPSNDSLLAEEEDLLRRKEEALAREKAARLARIKQLEEEEEESRRLEEDFKKKKEMFSVSRSSTSSPMPKKVPPPPPVSRSKVPPPPPASRPMDPIPPAPPAPVVTQPPVSTPVVVVDNAGFVEDAAPPALPPSALPAPPSPNSPAASTNPFHKFNASANVSPVSTPSVSLPTKLSPNNPFFKPTDPPVPPAPSQVPFRPPPRPQDSDDEWDAAEDNDDDDSDEEGAATARQARQGLAEALFGGIMPSRPPSAAPNSAGCAPAAPSAPPPPPAPQAPPPPAVGQAAPASPPSVPGNRGKLLSEIQGGARLRKTQTNDRSTSSLAGRVLGSSSPPPPKSRGAEEDRVRDQRRSVDWIGGMAADGMRSPPQMRGHQPTLEAHVEEWAGSAQAQAEAVATSTEDAASMFDLSQSMRVLSLYPYEAQRPEDLSLSANMVLCAHPSKVDGDWLYGTAEVGGKAGTFPRAYVEELQVSWGTALYAYTATSAEEVSLAAKARVAVVDASNADWFRVEDQGRVGLAPGAYIELDAGVSRRCRTRSVACLGPSSRPSTPGQQPLSGSALHGHHCPGWAMTTSGSEHVRPSSLTGSGCGGEATEVAPGPALPGPHHLATPGRPRSQQRPPSSDLTPRMDMRPQDLLSQSTSASEGEPDSEEDDPAQRTHAQREAEQLKILAATGLVRRPALSRHAQSPLDDGGSEQGPLETMEEDAVARCLRVQQDVNPALQPSPRSQDHQHLPTPARSSHPNFPSTRTSSPRFAASPLPRRSLGSAPNSTSSSSGFRAWLSSMSRTVSSVTTTHHFGPPDKHRFSAPVPPSSVPAPDRHRLSVSGPISVGTDSSSSLSSPGTIVRNWSHLIDPHALGDISDKERNRQEAIHELIFTEAVFVQSCQTLMQVFFPQMRSILGPHASTVIFANIEDITLFGTTFLSALEQRQKEHRFQIALIGDVTCTYMQGVEVYRPYCVNQSNAVQLLDQFSKDPNISQRLSSIKVRGLELDHYLLEPMQRLTRYPLLLEKILHYTDESSPDCEPIRASLKRAQDVLTTINESIREQENEMTLLDLSQRLMIPGSDAKLNLAQMTRFVGPRRLIRDGTVTKSKSRKMLHAYLFNDFFLLTTIAGSGGSGFLDHSSHGQNSSTSKSAPHRIMYRAPMALEECQFTSGKDDSTFVVLTGNESFNLKVCEGSRACAAWKSDLRSARRAVFSALAARKLKRASLDPAAARRAPMSPKPTDRNWSASIAPLASARAPKSAGSRDHGRDGVSSVTSDLSFYARHGPGSLCLSNQAPPPPTLSKLPPPGLRLTFQ